MITGNMKDFIILTDENSYLAASFEGAFEKKEIRAKVTGISEARELITQESINGLLICTSPNLPQKTAGIKTVADLAIKQNLPVFIMGNKEELDIVWSIIPKEMVTQAFLRPINMGSMVESICEQLEKRSKASGKKKILAVDDSGIILRNIKHLLEDTYQVILANSGAMAIKYLTLNTVDLILLDYEMPIVDGKQVMQMIREDTEFQNIPIIFLTGKNDTESVMKVMELKPDGYLLKTMEPQKLHQAIDHFFANH